MAINIDSNILVGDSKKENHFELIDANDSKFSHLRNSNVVISGVVLPQNILTLICFYSMERM